MPGLDFIDAELTALAALDRRRVVRTVTARGGAEVVGGGRTLVNFAGNDYLGLAVDPRLAQASARAEAELGVGAGASRLISGHTAVTAELERRLAAWVRRGSARLFNTGYAANTGLWPVLAGAGDVIFSDERNHASIIDGCRLAKARVVVYRHLDLDDLRRNLRASSARRRFVVSESLFSMDGDGPDLAALAAVAHEAEAALVVDDAHALGVEGPGGAGRAASCAADVIVGTLGKAVGSAGAFVAGPAGLADLLWNRSRPLIFSTGPTVGSQAAALEGIAIAQSAEGDARRARLLTHRERLRGDLGIAVESAIVPVVVGTDRAAVEASRALEAQGLWVPAIRPPTVAEGAARLRITVSAAHSVEQIDRLVGAVAALESSR